MPSVEEERIPIPPEPSSGDAKQAVVQCANLYLTIRRLLFTSLGAVALTADEARAFVDRLLERGEVGETDVQRLLDGAGVRARVAGANSRNHDSDIYVLQVARKTAGDSLEEPLDTLLGRLNVPTHHDIEELSRKIAQLDAKVSALRTKRMAERSHRL